MGFRSTREEGKNERLPRGLYFWDTRKHVGNFGGVCVFEQGGSVCVSLMVLSNVLWLVIGLPGV